MGLLKLEAVSLKRSENLTEKWVQDQIADDPSLDGVTGQIRLTPNQVFVRELPAAQFIDGKTVVLGNSR